MKCIKNFLKEKTVLISFQIFLIYLQKKRKNIPFDSNAELKIISAIVKLEVNRKSDSKKSELTHLVPAIKKVEGVSLLFSILEIMEYERVEIVSDFSLKSLYKKIL